MGNFLLRIFYCLKHFNAIFQSYRKLIKQEIWQSLVSKSTVSLHSGLYMFIVMSDSKYSGLYMFIVMSDSELEMMN